MRHSQIALFFAATGFERMVSGTSGLFIGNILFYRTVNVNEILLDD